MEDDDFVLNISLAPPPSAKLKAKEPAFFLSAATGPSLAPVEAPAANAAAAPSKPGTVDFIQPKPARNLKSKASALEVTQGHQPGSSLPATQPQGQHGTGASDQHKASVNSAAGIKRAAATPASSRPDAKRKVTAAQSIDIASAEAGDDDESADLASLVALSLAKDALLEADLAKRSAAVSAAKSQKKFQQTPAGIVDFQDDLEDEEGPDDESWAASGRVQQAKRQRKQEVYEARAKSLAAAVASAKARSVVAGSAGADAVAVVEAARLLGDGGATTVAAGAAPPAKAAVQRHVPGQLAHADVTVPASAGVQVYGDGASWQDLGVDAGLVEQLLATGFAAPTRVQQSSLPLLLAGRDALVKAPTGSGKTLAYLVPIIHQLQGLSPRISRSDGTQAILVAPTRELCIQIHDVAVLLTRRYHWLVVGMLLGGEHRGHEKARLRKGVTLLAASPGRLLDHLQNTVSFKTDSLRWLVLDEADRLLDLGFEQRLKEIMQLLDSRSSSTHSSSRPSSSKPHIHTQEGVEQAAEDADTAEVPQHGGASSGGFDWDLDATGRTAELEAKKRRQQQRQTLLLSATLHQQLSALARASLHNPAAVGFEVQQGKGGLSIRDGSEPGADGPPCSSGRGSSGGEQFTIPPQLRQSFIEVSCKQRLVTLAALLRQKTLVRGGMRATAEVAVAAAELTGKGSKAAKAVPGAGGGGGKVVVFMSSCDSVECYHLLLADVWKHACGAALLDAPLLKLHGDMVQAERTATFVRFNQAKAGVLLCTDVAARGLDFPDVSTIIQFDVPGAPSEYVHRVGRTARMGHHGEAILFLQPHERAYVALLALKGVSLIEDSAPAALKWLPNPNGGNSSMNGGEDGEEGLNSNGKRKVKSIRSGGATSTELVAFELQRRLMGAVAADAHVRALAADAFRSFVRAYATHSGETKRVFHVRSLHLGHVAFSFGLKEAPGVIGQSGSSAERKRKKAEAASGKLRREKKNWKANMDPTRAHHRA